MGFATYDDAGFMTLDFAYELCEKFPELAIECYDGHKIVFVWENEKAASATNTDDLKGILL